MADQELKYRRVGSLAPLQLVKFISQKPPSQPHTTSTSTVHYGTVRRPHADDGGWKIYSTAQSPNSSNSYGKLPPPRISHPTLIRSPYILEYNTAPCRRHSRNHAAPYNHNPGTCSRVTYRAGDRVQHDNYDNLLYHQGVMTIQ